ncbi:MAG: ATP-binding cassette domain-containing protein [Thermoanaerobaculia bacterium]
MLEIQNLVKVYPGAIAALQGVSVRIPQGMFGLLGPNGSGKSTLMRILSGLLEPSAGRVLFDGTDVALQPERIWPQLGHLPQSFGFYPNLTGEAMLTHMLRMKGVEAPRGLPALCAELLDRVNLTAAARRKVKTYSGGMRQRLGIAQAIAGDPALVIFDEPTAGLDPEERLRFYRLLTELAETRTVLLSTHLVEDVAMLCPRFAVIRQGRLLVTTTPGEARDRLAGTMFEGEVERTALAELAARHCVTQAHLVEGRNRIRLHLPKGEAPAGFSAVQPTLEDAYLVLIRSAVDVDPAVALRAAS